MSVVAVLKEGDEWSFAADSICVRGSLRVDSKTHQRPKLFQHNGLTIGGCGLAFENNMLEIYSQNHKPTAATPLAIVEYLLEFETWIRKRRDDFKADNEFLLAFEDKCFRTNSGYQVFAVHEFDAIGYGEDYARAALHLHNTPSKAVQTACDLCVWCHPPIIEMKHA